MAGTEDEGIREGVWLDLAVGFAVATLVLSVPGMRGLHSAIMTVFHEFGHTLADWFFGFPALPAFDLRYGGGVTTAMPQSSALLAVAYVILLGLAWTLAENPRGRVLAGALLVGYAATAHSTWCRAVISAAGHGGELVFAAIFFFRSVTGESVAFEAERTVYAAIAWATVIRGAQLALGLATSQQTRDWYEGAKGGGHWMDFSRLSRDHFGCDLETVAWAFLVACCLTPLVAVWAAFHREAWRQWLREAGQERL